MQSQDPLTTQEPIHLFVEASFADAPEWIPLLPTPGIYPHPSYGDVDMSTEAIDRYVENFNTGVYGQRQIPVDLEHDLPLSGAMGYMTEVRKNADGSVDARVDWNERGRTVLAENRFGYVSPTLRESWTDPVSMTTHRNVTVGAALTTRPYFKEQSLRPLIAASEPVAVRQEGTRMTEQEMQANKDAATAEGAAIVDKQFGEKIADLERKFTESETRFAESESARVKAEERVAALESAALDAKLSEQLRGFSETEKAERAAEYKALPDELRDGYIKRAQNEVALRRSAVNFKERGVDADIPEASALINARAAEIRASEPKLTALQARARATEQVFTEQPSLYRDMRAS